MISNLASESSTPRKTPKPIAPFWLVAVCYCFVIVCLIVVFCVFRAYLCFLVCFMLLSTPSYKITPGALKKEKTSKLSFVCGFYYSFTDYNFRT